MFKATAILRFDPKHSHSKFRSWWACADVPWSVGNYYRYWVKRELGIHLNTPCWKEHVSVVRGEEPKKPWNWKKREGQKVTIFYSHEIKMNDTYAWLSVESKELEEIRVELGLSPTPKVAYHLTFGNCKNVVNKTPKAVPFKVVFPWELPHYFKQ